MNAEPDNNSQQVNTSLYSKHLKVYPQRIAGTFRQLKWIVLGVLLGSYYVVPWLRWDRGPDMPNQAVLLDLAGRRGYFLNIEIWAQEVYYLTGILILGAVGLFLATALAGRVWCGFTCPQTVWTDLFLLAERFIEGDRNKRIKLDNSPLTISKAVKKIIKHIVWILIALLTGGAWIFYFVDAPTAAVDMLSGSASSTLYGFVALFAGFTYLLAGWAREQVCIYMCPWPRFQGSMFDEDSLLVTYEEWRGEPRGKAKQKDSDNNLGDCVDCGLCVNVCPTGTDIRLGQQFTCIGCALCIDACNSIMSKLDRPANLIAYDSISNQLARAEGRPAKKRFFRPRVLAYVAILISVIGIMVLSLATRDRIEINIQRDRSPLFVTLSNGDIRNGYTFKILNMEAHANSYILLADELDNALITVVGIESKGAKEVILDVDPDSIGTFRVFVRVSSEQLESKSSKLEFKLINLKTGMEIEQETVFYGPDD